MANEISYTTDEIAKLLKISKLTVYDLIKKGDLPSYRVGKQMRVDALDLEAYKTKSKGEQSGFFKSLNEPFLKPAALLNGVRTLVITGQDISLDILAKHLEKKMPGFRPLRANVGSLDSLISMYRGESDIVSTHLFDGETGQYNLPFIRRMLIGFAYVVIHLLSREAGFYVQKGNPKNILTWSDLQKNDITLVNREKGSGIRILLEEQLRIRGIATSQIHGFEHEESNHLSVAGQVSLGLADVGIGMEKAAQMVGVDFVPLVKESYDLVMLKSIENLGWIEIVKQTIRSDAYKLELQSIHGYDLTQTGKVLYET